MARIKIARNVVGMDAQAIRPALTTGAFTLDGGRHHAIVLLSGGGSLRSDTTSVTFAAPCALWLPIGGAARLTLNAGTRGARIATDELALGQALPAGPLGAEIKETLRRPIPGRAVAGPAAQELAQAIGAIGRESATLARAFEAVCRHHLAVLLIGLWRAAAPATLSAKAAPSAIVRRFLDLAELRLRDHWRVEDYAGELGISRARLTSAVRRATGQTPQGLLHARLVQEAETLLFGSNLQTAEIAEALGFKDPGYFNRFFKRQTGIAPGRRRRLAGDRPARDQSFAAWP
ncbi:helix-turn-helix domain-containing protein [Pararhizobium haloflavum]|uniref:helix-turn-helix domain-containing protein n=1 Tax=Pararhizobium haloflavum TaxID=2037914 RepID=UPI000C183634|nr:helix-turn-helix domain-containing protein [Pararhizobium haloflavum]